MYTQGYNPDFWTQEFVEKLFFENFPAAKINDIVSYFEFQFDGIVPEPNTFFYGFLESHTSSFDDIDRPFVYVQGTSVAGGYRDYPVYLPCNFPILINGLHLESEPGKSYFTGWKITTNSPVIVTDDEPELNYDLTDSLIVATTNVDVFQVDAGDYLVAAKFANEDSSEVTDNVGSNPMVDEGGYFDFSDNIFPTVLKIVNHGDILRSKAIIAGVSYLDVYDFNQLPDGFLLNLKRAGSLTVDIGTIVSGLYVFAAHGYNQYGTLVDDLGVTGSGNYPLTFGTFSIAANRNVVVRIQFTDNVFDQLPSDTYHRVLKTWYTHFQPKVDVSDSSTTDYETIQIEGVAAEVVEVKVTNYTNNNGGTLTFNGVIVTAINQTFSITLNGSGLSGNIPVHIDGLVAASTAILGKFEIVSASGGNIGLQTVYQISKVF